MTPAIQPLAPPIERTQLVSAGTAQQSSVREPWVGAFVAGSCGWTLDAFDFFLVVLSLTTIGNDFGQSVPHMALTAWATVHGLASLVVDGQLAIARVPGDASEVARATVRVLFKGLGA